MKIINSVVLIFCLFLSMSFYGQTNDSLQNVNTLNSRFYTPGFTAIDQPITLKKLDLQTKAPTLVLYNKTTNLYDIYLDVNDSYSYSGSKIMFRPESNFFTTLFLGNDSYIESNTLIPNSSLLLGEDVSYPVRDSFNPNGASNFSEALIGGVFGLLFN